MIIEGLYAKAYLSSNAFQKTEFSLMEICFFDFESFSHFAFYIYQELYLTLAMQEKDMSSFPILQSKMVESLNSTQSLAIPMICGSFQ